MTVTTARGPQGPAGEDAVNTTISLSFMGRYEIGEFDESAAEIVDFHPATRQAFVINANSGEVDVLNAMSPFTPTLNMSLDVAGDVAVAMGLDTEQLGAANSVAVHEDMVAVAIEADPKQNNGYVAFYQANGSFVGAVEAGALPDMVTITPDGNKVIVANEGEPNGDYSVEPEYVVVSGDSSTAYVILQENNAVAVVDLHTNTVTANEGDGREYVTDAADQAGCAAQGGFDFHDGDCFHVYNISNPQSAEFVQYINTRNFTIADVEDQFELAGDLGPESIKFVAVGDSPTDVPMLIVGNEVSGTTAFFDIEVIVQ